MGTQLFGWVFWFYRRWTTEEIFFSKVDFSPNPLKVDFGDFSENIDFRCVFSCKVILEWFFDIVFDYWGWLGKNVVVSLESRLNWILEEMWEEMRVFRFFLGFWGRLVTLCILSVQHPRNLWLHQNLSSEQRRFKRVGAFLALYISCHFSEPFFTETGSFWVEFTNLGGGGLGGGPPFRSKRW